MKTDIEYSFELSESIEPDYKVANKISTWLHDNLDELTDDKDNKIFNKINYGFNEENLKGFGKKPVCDIYINNIDYNSDFENTPPKTAHSILIFYMKGANDVAYLKCCDLHDYLIQEFITNDSFKCLDGVVKDTVILNSELMNQPFNKKWGVMGALELSHILY